MNEVLDRRSAWGNGLQELGLNQLRAVVHEARDAVPTQSLLRLAHSMPRQLQMCIENQGGQIDY